MKIFDWHREKQRTHCTAIIVAAGNSTRMNGIDKIMADLNGEPVIIRTIRAFQEAICIDEIVLVVREGMVEKLRRVTASYDFTKVQAVVPGGDTRMASVMAGLLAASKKTVLVAIQDGARPLVTPEVIKRTVDLGLSYHAAAPAVPVTDTIKVVGPTGRVESTPDRSTLRAVQTPQIFDRDLLMAAWERARKERILYTDDCSAMEGLGIHVYLTEGSEENIKITTPLDLQIARMILNHRAEEAQRAAETANVAASVAAVIAEATDPDNAGNSGAAENTAEPSEKAKTAENPEKTENPGKTENPENHENTENTEERTDG